MADIDEGAPIRIAIVGCGQIIVHHCAALSAIGGIEIYALCDLSSERRRIIRELIPSSSTPPLEFSSLDDLLDDQSASDACSVFFISVPHDLHVTIAQRALNAGKHVVLEKPLAPTLDGCRSLQETAVSAKGLLIVSEQSPYWEEIAKAKELASAGAIGNLVSASSYYYESMRDNVTSGVDDSGGLGWRCSLERCGGGIVVDGGLHWIRPLRELCGDVESVVGVARYNVQPGLMMEGETLAHALLRMKRKSKETTSANDDASDSYLEQPPDSGPLIATFSANMMHTAPMAHDVCPYFRFTGTEGELVVYGTGLNPNGGGGLRLYNKENPTGKDLFPSDRQGGFFLGFQGVWKSMSDILRRNDREAAQRSVREAAADVAVALALYKSTESNAWEECEEL